MKSDNPAVRFRADQILQRLKGASAEQPLEDGTKGEGSKGPAVGPGSSWRSEMERALRELRERFGGTDDAFKDFEKKMKELEEQWGIGSQPFPWAQPGLRIEPFRWLGGVRQGVHVRSDAGNAWVEVSESPRGARIAITSKTDASDVTTFSGKTVAAIVAAHPK